MDSALTNWLQDTGRDIARAVGSELKTQAKDRAVSMAKEQLGFRSVFVWKNDEKPNTTFVEDRLQGRYHELGLPRRLHRQVGMGDNGFYIEPK